MAGPSASLLISEPVTDINEAKAWLRVKLKARRAEANAANGAAIAALAAERFLAAIPCKPDQVVAGYWPMPDELDPRPLLSQLRQRGQRIVLPGIAAKLEPLHFRLWMQEAAPPMGRLAIPAPPESQPQLRPDILILPLVGFDAAGHRLGLGGGFYDVTVNALRRDGGPAPLVVGYAFAVQQVQALPADHNDARLDWAVTERGAQRFE
jgi:5-formyltetrahydrofolate cyclo-ligase